MMYTVFIFLCIAWVLYTRLPTTTIMGSYPELKRMLDDFPATSIYNDLMEKNVTSFLEAYSRSFIHKVSTEDMKKYARRFQKYALEIILRLPGDMRLQETLEDHIRQVMETLETLLKDIEIRHGA